jgi:ABC-type oligopeptide transport system substrate-binding subunit
MEAFKAGAYDFREEFTSKVWATEYDFPAIRDGRVKKEVLPDETPSGTQGFFLNTRRDALKTRGCGRRSISPSTSSGPTAMCSMGSTRAR